MCYVAADPKQPGAAWAASVDDGKFPELVAEDVAGFVRRGAIVMRVDVETAREMMSKWVRPGKQGKLGL
jgi:hypothetical protein